jgi:hypothetical protein
MEIVEAIRQRMPHACSVNLEIAVLAKAIVVKPQITAKANASLDLEHATPPVASNLSAPVALVVLLKPRISHAKVASLATAVLV